MEKDGPVWAAKLGVDEGKAGTSKRVVDGVVGKI